jgi:hypothetical protein
LTHLLFGVYDCIVKRSLGVKKPLYAAEGGYGDNENEITTFHNIVPGGNMLSEYQAYKIGDCKHCEGDAIFCEDWDEIRWAGEDPFCIHELDPTGRELETETPSG